MHRIIIPIDFSQTSLNAARFVAKMVAGYDDATIILYHNYKHDNEYDSSKTYLISLQNEMLENGDAFVEYEMEKGGDLIDNLDKIAHTRRATLIAMGLTGRTELQQKYIGGNTLRTVDRCLYPVMIIPPDADFKKIENVAFASDFSDVENSTPASLINAVLEIFNPKLHIVNVNPAYYICIDDNGKSEQLKLEKLFSNYEVDFHFLTIHDFHDAKIGRAHV